MQGSIKDNFRSVEINRSILFSPFSECNMATSNGIEDHMKGLVPHNAQVFQRKS